MTMFETNPAAFIHQPPHVTGPELGRARIEAVIAKGRSRAAHVMDFVEKLQPVDKLVKTNKLAFEFDKGALRLVLPDESTTTLHRNALAQAAERAKIPMGFLEYLRSKGEWGSELLASNFNELFAHTDERALLRIVNGDTRGFLSDRYRRLDSRPLVDSFAQACASVGALPYEGYATDTKVSIQAIIPKVYEPVPNEIMAYGANFENSDFGNGALNVSFFALRLQCLNGMIGETSLRQVHLGKRLDDSLNWSEKTHTLDMKTIVSGVHDMVKGQLAEARIEDMQLHIRKAYESKLDDTSRKSVLDMLKKYMNKGELDKAMSKFNEPDVELLPPGNNLWRMSNAVSWLAGETDDAERKLELQRLAGKVLPS